MKLTLIRTLKGILTIWMPAFVCAAQTEYGKIVRIIDGDTLMIETQADGSKKIRLSCIDSPELDQKWGPQAKQFVESCCRQKKVKLRKHGQDRFGRTIATIYLDGRNLNRELVKEGYARAYPKYMCDDQMPFFETEARNKKKGMWRSSHPVDTALRREPEITSRSIFMPIKKSRSDICHTSESTYYSQTKIFETFDELALCLKSGGRLPKD